MGGKLGLYHFWAASYVFGWGLYGVVLQFEMGCSGTHVVEVKQLGMWWGMRIIVGTEYAIV